MERKGELLCFVLKHIKGEELVQQIERLAFTETVPKCKHRRDG